MIPPSWPRLPFWLQSFLPLAASKAFRVPSASGTNSRPPAVVSRLACGGAFYMLGEVEFIIASDDAVFFDPHVTYGMTAAFEPMQMLSKMPFQEIMRLSLLGAHERMSAARAHQIGLVSEVVPRDELLERLGQAGAVEVLGDDLRAGRERRALDLGN